MGNSSSPGTGTVGCCVSRDTNGVGETSTLDELASPLHDAISTRMFKGGLAADEVFHKRLLFTSAANRLIGEGYEGSTKARAFWVPGRIEVGGKHTDYAGGRSLLGATTKGFAVVSVDREDAKFRMLTAIGEKSVRLSAELAVSPDLEPIPGHWSAYPAVAIRRFAKNFDLNVGVDAAVERDLPEASGMSSSSAIICLVWMILSRRGKLTETAKYKEAIKTDDDLYGYLGCVENGQDYGPHLPGEKGVGTFGGSEDHTAIMSSLPNKLRLYSFCPTRSEGIFSVPSDSVFCIAVSGAFAEKTGDKMEDYNMAAFLARDAAEAWCLAADKQPLGGKTFVPGKANLAEVIREVSEELGVAPSDPSVRQSVGDMISKVDDGRTFGPDGKDSEEFYTAGMLRERFEQFFDESEVLVPKLANAFENGDGPGIKSASSLSHKKTVENLRNTIPETAWLPQHALNLGAFGASAFGAGFGGSCWAFVRKSEAKSFLAKWRDAYLTKFPRWQESSLFFQMNLGPAAFQV
eukprot:TRINITY_DN1916_c0_g1_i5.p1 TRINITY_DN1916_c0_g1~~TRINITY_DN1916_c0_g1_i5.p1  ORF type:complete len:520 (-),score=101.24 TRINITY_DN1916_c0_g1_i5:327-1886(-)